MLLRRGSLHRIQELALDAGRQSIVVAWPFSKTNWSDAASLITAPGTLVGAAFISELEASQLVYVRMRMGRMLRVLLGDVVDFRIIV